MRVRANSFPLQPRQILVTRGGYPYLVPSMDDPQKVIAQAANRALHDGFVQPDDYLTIISGQLPSVGAGDHILKVLKVSEVLGLA